MKAPISGIRSATGASGIIAGALSVLVGIAVRAVFELSRGYDHSYDMAPFDAASVGYLLSSLALFVVSIVVLATRGPTPVRIAAGASAVQIVLWNIMLVLMGGSPSWFAALPVIWSAIPFGYALRSLAVDPRPQAVSPQEWFESLVHAVVWRFRTRRAQIILNACAGLAGLAAALVGIVVWAMFDQMVRLDAALAKHAVGTAFYDSMRSIYLGADQALGVSSLIMLCVAFGPSRVLAAVTALAAAFQGCAWVAYEASSNWDASFLVVPMFFTVVASALATATVIVRPSRGRGRGA